MLLAHMVLSSEFSDLTPCLIHYHKLWLNFSEFNLPTHWNILWLARKTVLKIYNQLNEKFAYPNSTTMPVQVEDIKTSISHITVLCKEFLINVPIGNKRSKIYLVMTSDEGGDTWQTFNKQLDALFAEDCRDGQGWLHHICHGEFGMDKVVQYLSTLDINLLPLDLVAKKLDWLEAELEILSWVWLLESDTKHPRYWIAYLQAEEETDKISFSASSNKTCRG